MSYIERTKEETELGQFAKIKKAMKGGKESGKDGIDIFLVEGRVHLDSDDVAKLKAFLEGE